MPGSWPITCDDITAARERIATYLPPTPLRSYAGLDDALGMHVLVKHENHQPTNAFKVRNAFSAITGITPEQRKRGVTAASTGNYGQGLAYAGSILGVPVTICAPRGANPDKLAAIRGYGAEIVQEGDYYDQANCVADRLVQERGVVHLHGINHPLVPAGAGTMTLEIFEQAAAMGERIDAILIAIGGGSQAVGAMTVIRHRGLATQVIGVQSEAAPALYNGWKSRTPQSGPPPRTFAEGVATGATYDLTFGPLCDGLADFIAVSEEQIAAATRLAINATHSLVEPAGACGIAALGRCRERFAGKTVVVIFSGGNIDMKTLQRVLGG